MKIIEREGYIHVSDMASHADNFTIYKDKKNSLLGDTHLLKVKVLIELPSYKLFLKSIINKQNNYQVHLVNKDDKWRLSHNQFTDVIRALKRGNQIPHDLSWDLYPGQPVYEFFMDPKELAKRIIDINPQIEIEIL